MNLDAFKNPTREFSLMPFWFWNDQLDKSEIIRQISEFESHSVFGFVLHPRVGLPRSIGWMSDAMLDFMEVAISEAARRNMFVILYDEGMYPSGSSCGMVAAENPRFACRGLERLPLPDGKAPSLPDGCNLLASVREADGKTIAIVDRPSKSHIRGIHYIQDDPSRHPGPDRPNNPGAPRPDPPEDEPLAADLLNPDATACFIQHVYQRLYDRFARYFGKTILAFFTDEPSLLGRGGDKGLQPGTTDILAHVNRLLGYDFTPHLPALWSDREPDALLHRSNYMKAVDLRLEETYYQPISKWCAEHGVALTGHPSASDQIGALRYFDWPGQDLVWRYVVPDDPSALEGAHATMAKCSSSAAIHMKRKRNLNEFCGAYGHQLTFEEMKWLADWCFVRGVNLLVPHAFYYSVRGPRWDERPPDVGLNSSWWNRFGGFADYCRRLSWLNASSQHICDVAVLGNNDFLPWKAAKALQQHQIDFNYFDARHLWLDATVDETGIRLAGMHYRALILDDLPKLPAEADVALNCLRKAGRLIEGLNLEAPWPQLERLVARDVHVTPRQQALRFRHNRINGEHVYLFHNECREKLECQLKLSIPPPYRRMDSVAGTVSDPESSLTLSLGAYETALILAGAGE